MTTVIIRRRKLGMGSCKAIAEQSKEGIKVVRNWKDDFPEDTNLVIRWGCTSNVPTRNVVNTAAAIHTVGDKASFRKTLQDNHPEIVPKTWFDWEEVPDGEEVIIRSSYHAQGRNLWVTTDKDFMRDKCWGDDQVSIELWLWTLRQNYFRALTEKRTAVRSSSCSSSLTKEG